MTILRANILRHHDAHPLVLDLLLTKEFGPEWWSWEPETLRQVIPQQFKTAEGYAPISELVWNKLQAVRTVHVSPGLVFDEWECFLPVITSLNNVIPDFNVMQLPSHSRLLAGVGMLKALDPEETFSEEVKRFSAAALLHDGIYYAPGDLSFCQWYLRRPYYICPKCGNREDLLFEHDGICDNCGKEYFSKMTGTVIDASSKVDFHKTYDEGPVRDRFQQAAKNWDEFFPSDDDEIDVQVAKLAAAVEYKAMRDQQFLEQKESLQL